MLPSFGLCLFPVNTYLPWMNGFDYEPSNHLLVQGNNGNTRTMCEIIQSQQ